MNQALLAGYGAVVGAMVGSFLNVCVYRWPEGLSVLSPSRSFCPACRQQIRWHDNLPVLGWFLLRGRCRDCGVTISAQYPIVEFLTALIWVFAALRFGFTFEALRAALFLTILLGIALTDLRHMLIPDQFSLGGAVLGILLALAPGGITVVQAIVGAAVGYGLFWAVMVLGEKAFRKPALGLGDVHMLAMIGAFLGWQRTLLTILLASVLGVLFAVPALVLRGRYQAFASYLPFGVFLALGAALAYLWGDYVIDWYVTQFLWR